jgi:hypothetical protein
MGGVRHLVPPVRRPGFRTPPTGLGAVRPVVCVVGHGSSRLSTYTFHRCRSDPLWPVESSVAARIRGATC